MKRVGTIFEAAFGALVGHVAVALDARLGVGAEGGREVVEGEAVCAEAAAGRRVAALVEGRDARRVAEAGKDQQTVGGEFARVLGRGVVARRQRAGEQLDEPRARRRLEAAERLDLARRDEAAHGHFAARGAGDDFANRRLVLGDGLLEREAHVEEEGRAEERKVADLAPGVRRVEDRVANRAEAPEAVGVAKLPERARRVERDVAANGLELARVKRKLDVGAAVEAQRTDGGCAPAPLRKGACASWRTAGRRGFRGCTPAPRLKEGVAPRWESALAFEGGGAGAAFRDSLGEQAGGVEGGCGGLPPSVQRPRGFNGLHEHEADPERVEGRRAVVVDDHQEVDVVGHDDAVGERRAGVDLVEREQHRERRLAAWRQRGRRSLVDEARQRGGAALQRERDEEELAPPMVEVQLHVGSIANLRDARKRRTLGGGVAVGFAVAERRGRTWRF